MTTDTSAPYVLAAVRGLTKAQRRHIKDGYISDPFSMVTVRNLISKNLMFMNPTSPNGRCGPVELTGLGKLVQARLREADHDD